MSLQENRIVRTSLMALGSVFALWIFKEISVRLLAELGTGTQLISEMAGSKMFVTRMFIYFFGLGIAYAAFGKGEGNRWKMAMSVVFLAFLVRPVTGGAFGSMDRVLFFMGLAALAVHELEGLTATVVGCLIGGAAVMLFGVENVDAIPKSGIAAMLTVALFVAPAIRLTSFVMEGELNLKPIRRLVAKALPVMK